MGYDKGSPVPGGGKIKQVYGLDIIASMGYDKEAADMPRIITAYPLKETTKEVKP